MCAMESVIIPRPPALPKLQGFSPTPPPLPKPNKSALSAWKKPDKPPPTPPPPPPPSKHVYSSVRSSKNHNNNNNGFRLTIDHDSNNNNNNNNQYLIDKNNNSNCETGSVYSVYKQKIDQMFDSDTSLNNMKNSVQFKIDKTGGVFEESPKSELKIEENAGDSMGVHSFTVDYLGSVPLNDKVTSLAGLQGPLKDLYFAYKKITKLKKMLTGRLEISGQGLKVQYQGEKGDLEQMNSFPTIAVWSAVKFVVNGQDSSRKSYAFLPLITDPDNLDKRTLFRNFEGNEEKYINSESHSPLFAVVMRKIGVHKQLECHSFVCQTSEDAIVIAATLYKALMSQMKVNKEKKPKNRNGVTCMSIASSVYNENNNNNNNGVPVRPPRRKRSTTSSIASDNENLSVDLASDTQPLINNNANGKKTPKKSLKSRKAPRAPSEEDLDAILPYEEPIKVDHQKTEEIKPKSFSDKISTFMSAEQKQITAEIKQRISDPNSQRGLKRLQSLRRRSSEEIAGTKENSGDILTKVTIPRSGSFLNAGGLTRYKSKITRVNGQASGGSPLGFNELFNEFRLHEGLHSMDEILGAIIDPNGMSFNDLKPIYKEFLLKLSVTLTKDELYQRSKAIMRRQKKKILRKTRAGRNQHNLKVGSKFRRLKHIFRRRLRWKVNSNGNAKTGSGGNNCKHKHKIEIATLRSKLPESTISSSSYDTRHFVPKEDLRSMLKQQRKKSSELRGRRERLSTSEESDFLSVKRRKNLVNGNHQNRNSSSGYVSCSDCSYDSDSCTCTSADKCYCSLNKNATSKPKYCKTPNPHPSASKNDTKKNHNSVNGNGKTKKKNQCYCTDGTLTFCGCDTDSCAESNKCYCPSSTAPHKPRSRPHTVNATTSLFEQLKQRGFVQQPFHKKLCKRDSNTKSTTSLEYMPNPNEVKYYEKLKTLSRPLEHYYGSMNGLNDYHYQFRRRGYSESLPPQYDLFSSNEDFRKFGGVGGFPRTLSESAEHVGYFRQSCRATYGSSRMEKSVPTSSNCPEALSAKKTAEIAALFSDMKLSQSTGAKNERTTTTTVSSYSMFNNKFRHAAGGSVPCRNLTYADIKPEMALNNKNNFHHGRMIQNSLYGSNRSFHKSTGNGNKMFDSKNGLYTIQSQSDDSRRSSIGKKHGDSYRFSDLNLHHYNRLESEKNSLENSLGYLP